MTLSTTINTKTYTGDNSTVAFAFPYLFYADSDLVVTVDDVAQVLSTDYTVSGAENPAGGTITFTTAPATSAVIVIQRVVGLTQETDLENFDGNPADVTEKQFDLLVMADQQIDEKVERAILTPVTATLTSNEISGTIDSTVRALTITTSGVSTSLLASVSTDIDTIFTSLASGDFLQYNGSNWVNISEINTDEIADSAIETAKINDNAVTLAKLEHGTSGDILYYGASGTPTRLAKGTDDQVLTLASGLPSWGNASSGSWVALSTQTVSSPVSSVDFTSGIDSTYKTYVLIADGIETATDGAALYIRTSTDGGSTFDSGASDYKYAFMRLGSTGTSPTGLVSDGAAQIQLGGVGNGTGEGSRVVIHLSNPSDTNKTILSLSQEYIASDGEFFHWSGGGLRDSAADVDAIRILAATGNITSGTFTLYGISGA